MVQIQPVVGPDFGRLIQQGLQTFGAVQGLQQRQRQAQRREEIETLTRGIQTDPTKLAQLQVLDPERAQLIQQTRDAADERLRKERPLIASQIVGQPQNEQIRVLTAQIQRVNERGGDASNTQGLLDLIQGTPEQNQQAQGFIQNAIAQGEREGILEPQAGESRTAFAKNLETVGIDPRSKLAQQLFIASQKGSSQSFTVSPDGTVTFQSGKGLSPAGLQKKTVTDLEKKLVVFETNLDNLKRIESQIKPEFLTFAGRGKAFFSGLKSKAGADLSKEEKSFLQERTRFTQNINQFFNAYRKEITGAAASVQEMEGLKRSMFNEDLSPVEFEAAFDEFKNGVQRGRRLTRKLLREGVGGNLKNKRSEVSKRFDQEFTTGGDDSALERIEELQGTKSEEEIFQILENEGYDF